MSIEPNVKTLIDDYTSASYTYICWTYDLAALTSQAKWIVKRLEVATEKIIYADRNGRPDNISSSLTYV